MSFPASSSDGAVQPLYLCATTRLAQTLRAQSPATQPAAAVWRTPLALTLGQWLATLADEVLLCGLADLPRPLDPYGERLLWEQVIAESLSDAAPLFDLPGMAASAAEAHQLTRLWPALQQPVTGLALADEAQLFRGWQAAFVHRCRERGWIDNTGWQRCLLDLLAGGELALPPRIIFIGFDRLTPLEMDLLSVLETRGCVVEQQAFAEFSLFSTVDRENRQILRCADSAAECVAAAAWAQAQLVANPAARLGIVAPNLADVRDRLEFLLDDALQPLAIRPDAAELPRRFNFSLGRALAAFPLIRCALDLLALAGQRGKVEQMRLSQLLLMSGWAGDESEADARARLDAAMRRDLGYFTTLPALLRLSERLASDPRASLHLPRTQAALQALAAAGDGVPRRQLPSAWARVFATRLQAAGWPGERPLSSHEFQARRAFAEVLDALGRLDELLGPVDQGAAVRRLGELCRQRLFQPETRGQPAIQVLGVLESAGLQFDALWVMGMNDDVWPPAPRPNPLLPAERLRAVGAAHASAEVELDFARRVHARLLQSAPEIVLSWAQADGNRLRRPSPLLAGLPALMANPSPLVTTLAQQELSRASLDAALGCHSLPDALAPPLADGESVAGGSWLLRAQAICPAWAFYQFRLHAEAMDEAVEGLDPAARGTLVHGALEAFWRETKDSLQLRAQTPEGRQEAIASACAEALSAYEAAQRSPLPPRFRQLEAQRLQRLLARWLDVEARRGGDFTVIACEQRASVEIEGIVVTMVVDRIDAVEGGQLILDYKTGAAIDIKNWATERITEPQLPIYAALVADQVIAVAFAKVLPDKPAFAGVAASGELLPGVPALGDGKQKVFPATTFPDWSAVVAHWRAQLAAIACEVRRGEAGVVFSDEKLLQYCEVKALLRLPERQRWLSSQ